MITANLLRSLEEAGLHEVALVMADGCLDPGNWLIQESDTAAFFVQGDAIRDLEP
jgi:hypothetical protein